MAGPVVKRRKLSYSPSPDFSSEDDEPPQLISDAETSSSEDDEASQIISDAENSRSEEDVAAILQELRAEHDEFGLSEEEDSDEDMSDAEEEDQEREEAAAEDTEEEAAAAEDIEEEEEELDELDVTSSNKAPQDKEDNAVQSKGSQKPKIQRKNVQNPLLEEVVYSGEIYKSNMFKLQVDELLKQTRIKSKLPEDAVEKALRALKSVIEETRAPDPVSVANAESTLKKSHGVTIPFPSPRPPKDAKYNLEFRKPSYINAIGSYPTKLITKGIQESSIDLMVVMPSSLFQDKDYLNHRYFYKRAYYLAYITGAIKFDKSNNYQLSYDLLHGNQLLPVLVVREGGSNGVKDTANTQFSIRILPAVSESVFSLERTLLDKNCVRPKSTTTETEDKQLETTPFYNSSVRVDSTMTHYLKSIHRASTLCEAYKSACILGRVWLSQRGFTSDLHGGGFGNFEWSAVMATLLQTSNSSAVLSPGYSSYQLFKATLQFLSSRDLCKHQFHLTKRSIKFPVVEDHPIFFDADAGLNILFKMSPWSYKLLREEAAVTVRTLGDSLFDQFAATYKTRVNPLLLRHDVVVSIPAQSLKSVSDSASHKTPHSSLLKLYNVLSRGLGDRVTSIAIHSPTLQPWNIESGRSNAHASEEIKIGLTIDFAHVSRTIDRGPSAESKQEATSFRTFWGEKAELRRFKDGSIVETLEWSANQENGTVLEQILSHVLSRHLGKELAASITLFGEQTGRLLPGSNANAGIVPFKPIMAAFTTLERDLRALDELPLQFRHILAASPNLGYSSVEVPKASGSRQSTQPSDVIIEFEGSARWPDDIPAMQKTKIAFLLKIAEVLEQKSVGVLARVGLENESNDLLNQCFLDITYPAGATFRLRIRLDREQTTLERQLKLKRPDTRVQEGLAEALATYKRNALRTPSHIQALQTLSTRFPALSPTIRLTKKWFNSHLLSPHMPSPLIDLLAIRTFVQPHPWSPPSSPSTGLLRTLFFLSRWSWRTEPLIVDLSAALTPADLAPIQTRFSAWRNIDPALTRLVLFAASSADPDGSTWTDHARPPKVVAARMVALAQAASQAALLQGTRLDVKTLFVSSLGDYDFVLRLHPRVTRAAREKAAGGAADGQFKNLQLQHSHARAAKEVGFDPVALFVADLERVYGSCALFFHDGAGGKVIAGLWNPTAATPRQWKVMISYSTRPVAKAGKSEADAVLNRDAILSEIARFGGDMIEKVEVQKK